MARDEQRLAQRWRHAVATGGIAGTTVELRREVLARLVGDQAGGADPDLPGGTGPGCIGADADPPGAARLLDPPSVHEVRAALVALGMDALVYLVPGDGKPGAAVVIHASEPPSWLLLPELHRSGNPELDRFLATTSRGAAGGRRDIESPTAEDVEQVCDWAWRVAVGPLLRQHLPEPAGGRPARIVLVPIRELARVPWHAARRRTPRGYEYAVQDAVFSYAASARLLCEVAWRAAPPLSGAGLIVGDPDPGAAACHLPAARVEALAIRSAFYRDARYLGRLADGSVSPEGAGRRAEVVGWLSRVTGGEVLHLACHGVVQDGTGSDDTSYLLLAGEERLAAEELVDALRTAPGRGVGLAVLAACRSGTSGRGYDEAFSLATALLASDARSVVSAQWSVPDEETSVLMFLFHHYLWHGGHPPADALRAAQLWLLEGPREPPATMPPWLRERVPGQEDRVPVSGWAGFIHSGW
jgi:hypothetical protein